MGSSPSEVRPYFRKKEQHLLREKKAHFSIFQEKKSPFFHFPWKKSPFFIFKEKGHIFFIFKEKGHIFHFQGKKDTFYLFSRGTLFSCNSYADAWKSWYRVCKYLLNMVIFSCFIASVWRAEILRHCWQVTTGKSKYVLMSTILNFYS